MNLNPFRSRHTDALAEAQAEAAAEERSRRSTHLAAEAAELERRAATFDDVVFGHSLAERNEADRVAKVADRLDRAAAALLAADRAAIVALAKLSKAADDYDIRVAEADRELRAAGLVAAYVDGDAVAEFAIGGGGRDGVHLATRHYPRINVANVLRRQLFGALRARGDRSQEAQGPLYRRLNWSGLLADLPSAYNAPAPKWRAEHAAAHAAALSPPPATESHREAVAAQQRREQAEEKALDTRARHAYRQAREESVAHIGELATQELELGRGLPLYAPRTEITEEVTA